MSLNPEPHVGGLRARHGDGIGHNGQLTESFLESPSLAGQGWGAAGGAFPPFSPTSLLPPCWS